MKAVKVSDVIDAIEKNGLTKIKDQYIRYDGYRNPVAGCAIGQAALNLDVRPRNLFRSLNQLSYKFTSEIVHMNDDTNKSLPEIAAFVRQEYPEYLSIVIEIVDY